MPTTLPGTGVPVTTAPVTTVNGAAAAASEVVQRVVVGTLAGTAFTDLGPVTRGAGVSDANTQRMTLASDGPAVTALSSLDTKTPAVGQALMVASRPVVIASNQSAIPVSLTSTTIAGSVATTGTFFQATQPVSLTSTTITGSVATTGTFFQATQPVSIAATANVAGTRNNNGSANVTGSFHLTVGGSDGTNLRPLSVDTTGRTNVNSILAAETTKIIGTVNIAASQTVGLVAGAAVIGALVANQSANISQVNGVAPLMGNGLTGTGSQRVTLASDNSAMPAAGQGATAAAVPAGATMKGLRAATANPTNATGGNLVAGMGDKAGRAVVTPVQVRELMAVQQTAVAVVTADQAIVAAGGAGVFHDITQLIITTAGAAAQTITIKDAVAGTTRLVLNYPNAAVAPGAPLVINFSPPLVQAVANTAWCVTQSVATACNFTVAFAKNL